MNYRDRSLNPSGDSAGMAGKRARKRRRRKRQRRLKRRMRKVGGTRAIRAKGDELLERAAAIDAAADVAPETNNTGRLLAGAALAGGLVWAVSQ